MEAAAEKSQLNIDTSSLESTQFACITSVVWNKNTHVTGGAMGNNEEGERCPVLISKTRGIEGCSNQVPNASALYQPQLKGGTARKG